MRAIGVKAARVARLGRGSIKLGATVRAVGRWWLRGWLEFTAVVGGGPEYLGGPRPTHRSGRGGDDAAG